MGKSIIKILPSVQTNEGTNQHGYHMYLYVYEFKCWVMINNCMNTRVHIYI